MTFKRIFFDRTNSRRNTIIIVLAFSFILAGLFGLVPHLAVKYTTTITAIGYVLLIVQFGKRFVIPNYVGWNRLTMVIKVKSFLGKAFEFKNIQAAGIKNHIFTLKQKKGAKIELDLTGIRTKDMDRLLAIIEERAGIQVKLK